jgi:catechol 2,3-dioxygenase-like lactoylglutathione lyase family enzyme
MPDRGLTHVALTCRDTDASVTFYKQIAELQVVHRRRSADGRGDVVWLGDGHHAFVLVLLPTTGPVTPLLGPLNHVGVACASRADVDRRVATARGLGARIDGPHDSPPPVGYWAVIDDPSGHGLELSYGQDVESVATGAVLDSSTPVSTR